MTDRFRNVSAGIYKLREILLGRKWFGQLRFSELMSPRSYPPLYPLPTTNEKLSKNSYSKRKIDREVKPNTQIPIEHLHEIKRSSVPTPGKVYHYDDHRAAYSTNEKIR